MTYLSPDLLLAVTARLTDEQRTAIVDRFTELNPSWRGAAAADVLDSLDQADSNLGELEPFYERHPELIGNPEAGFALYAVLWATGRLEDEAAVRLLLAPDAEFGMSMEGAMNYLERRGVPRGDAVRVVNQASRSSSPIATGGYSVAFKSSPGRGLRCHITAQG